MLVPFTESHATVHVRRLAISLMLGSVHLVSGMWLLARVFASMCCLFLVILGWNDHRLSDSFLDFLLRIVLEPPAVRVSTERQPPSEPAHTKTEVI